MEKPLIYPVGSTAACRYAAFYLNKAGFSLVDHPTPEITHLLLDIPSFGSDGLLRSGGDIRDLLRMLPHGICVVGGNLNHPALDGYKTMDFLADEEYLAENAAITADCALQIAAPLLTTTLQRSPALVIGWGRIGKCLAKLLHAIGNDVTVFARKERDRAMLKALGYHAVSDFDLSRYRIVFNTAPAVVLDENVSAAYRNCIKIDLASKRGIEGDDVVWARGLPGIHAPETSGDLISQTFIRLSKEER